MNYFSNLEKALNERRASYAEHPSEKSYKTDSTYTVDGEGKFPLRTEAPDSVLRKDISDAERLLHTVSPEHQAEVRSRIEKIKKERGWD